MGDEHAPLDQIQKNTWMLEHPPRPWPSLSRPSGQPLHLKLESAQARVFREIAHKDRWSSCLPTVYQLFLIHHLKG